MSHSPRVVRCGLIQCSNPINDEARPVAEIQKAMLAAMSAVAHEPEPAANVESVEVAAATVAETVFESSE